MSVSNNLVRFSVMFSSDSNIITDTESINPDAYRKLAKELGQEDQSIEIICSLVKFVKAELADLEKRINRHVKAVT